MAFSRKTMGLVALMTCSGVVLYLLLRKKAEAKPTPAPPEAPPEAPKVPVPEEEYLKEEYCVFFDPSKGYYCSLAVTPQQKSGAIACYDSPEKCSEEATARTTVWREKRAVGTRAESEVLSVEYYKVLKREPYTVYTYSNGTFRTPEGLPIPYITNLSDGAEALKHLQAGDKIFTVVTYETREGYDKITYSRKWVVLKEDDEHWYCEVTFTKSVKKGAYA